MENNCAVIIMLTRTIENNHIKCADYFSLCPGVCRCPPCPPPPPATQLACSLARACLPMPDLGCDCLLGLHPPPPAISFCARPSTRALRHPQLSWEHVPLRPGGTCRLHLLSPHAVKRLPVHHHHPATLAAPCLALHPRPAGCQARQPSTATTASRRPLQRR